MDKKIQKKLKELEPEVTKGLRELNERLGIEIFAGVELQQDGIKGVIKYKLK